MSQCQSDLFGGISGEIKSFPKDELLSLYNEFTSKDEEIKCRRFHQQMGISFHKHVNI